MVDNIMGHYPDMYPWEGPVRAANDRVRTTRSFDEAYPPDNIPVSALPGAIRELKKLTVGSWLVNAPVSEDMLPGAIVHWNQALSMWVGALAPTLDTKPTPKPDPDPEPEPGPLPEPGPSSGEPGAQSEEGGADSDASGEAPSEPGPEPSPEPAPPASVPSTPLIPAKLPCVDFDPRLDIAPTKAFSPDFMGVVVGPNSVQAHGIVRNSVFDYPSYTPLYLSSTHPGQVTTEDTGVFVGTVLVPGVLLLNVYAQIFERYFGLVKEELQTKIECEMLQLHSISKVLARAIEEGTADNTQALKVLQETITNRVQDLHSFMMGVKRHSDAIEADLATVQGQVATLSSTVEEDKVDGGRGYVVADIEGRATYNNYPEGTIVLVKDASGDPSVNKGPATYILSSEGDNKYWENMTTAILLNTGLGDVNLDQLLDTMQKAHTHENKALLDSITSFGDRGVKIGGVVIINADGTIPFAPAGAGGAGGAGEGVGGDGSSVIAPSNWELLIRTSFAVPGTSPAVETSVASMASDVHNLQAVRWVKALEEMPTSEDFATVLADVPDGGIFSVPTDEPATADIVASIDTLKAEMPAQIAAGIGPLQEVVRGITQFVSTDNGGAQKIAPHQDEQGIYGVATPTAYGHVRLLADPSEENIPIGTTFSGQAVRQMMQGRGVISWNGAIPSIVTRIDDSSFIVTTSGQFTLPAGVYFVELVGGGANGSGGYKPSDFSGGEAGGGGHSAIPVTGTIRLNASAPVQIVIGGAEGNTTVTCSSYSFTAIGATGISQLGVRGADYGEYRGRDGLSWGLPGGQGAWHGGYIDYLTSIGGSGGDGSRFSFVGPLAKAVRASTGGTSLSGGSVHPVPGGEGGYGFGAGGGGGGYSRWSDAFWKSTGGNGAPGCVMFTVSL